MVHNTILYYTVLYDRAMPPSHGSSGSFWLAYASRTKEYAFFLLFYFGSPMPLAQRSTQHAHLALGLCKQRSTKEYLTRKLKSSSEVCGGYVILDSYAILCESKTSSSPPKRLQGCDCAVRLNAKGMSVSSDHESPIPRPHFDSQLEAVVM